MVSRSKQRIEEQSRICVGFAQIAASSLETTPWRVCVRKRSACHSTKLRAVDHQHFAQGVLHAINHYRSRSPATAYQRLRTVNDKFVFASLSCQGGNSTYREMLTLKRMLYCMDCFLAPTRVPCVIQVRLHLGRRLCLSKETPSDLPCSSVNRCQRRVTAPWQLEANKQSQAATQNVQYSRRCSLDNAIPSDVCSFHHERRIDFPSPCSTPIPHPSSGTARDTMPLCNMSPLHDSTQDL